ncbi:MAG: barstar family protein [Betaproteobacteria bacterium]|nr:barstar family protein [Betaproteobacteria bacterium]
MGKLLQRLSDASRSGVYRAPRADDILDAVRGSALRVVRVGLEGVSSKELVLERIARALAFPDWFGGNWDALEDCLTDLSWLEADGHVLIFEDGAAIPADERGVLEDVLASAAAYWAERRHPFIAAFVGGGSHLAELYRSRK